MKSLDGFFAYDHLTHEPLQQRDWVVVDVPWNDHDVDWNAFAAVVIRSPWDYQDHAAEFLIVLETIEQSSARLLNSSDVVRWNLRKSYLRDLEERGVVIVPTIWCDPLDSVQHDNSFLQLSTNEVVVKPIIGANADDTFRLCVGNLNESARSQILRVFGNREAMIQPFVDLVLLPGGKPAVIEVELIEPSLYFQRDEQSPRRFAKASDRLLRKG